MSNAVEHVVTHETADGTTVTVCPSRKHAVALGELLRSVGSVAYVYPVSAYIQFIDPNFRGGKA